LIPFAPASRWLAGLLAIAAAPLGAALAVAGTPRLCAPGDSSAVERLPAPIARYLDSLGSGNFDQFAACARWAGTYEERGRRSARSDRRDAQPARLILFPAPGTSVAELSRWLRRSADVRAVGTSRRFVVAALAPRLSGPELRKLLDSSRIEYAEPDCDGPEFVTTSNDFMAPTAIGRDCWRRAARTSFPNDPCIDELWGHRLIGWDSHVAARSLPRMIAVLDSGIDATHEDLARNIVPIDARVTLHSLSRGLNARCATSGLCYPHGTEMAGTISGRMDNGIGVAGVAPNSHLLPLVISPRGQHGMLARLSTIAEAIDEAVADDVDIINISAKWPVESRAISEAIDNAIGGVRATRRLVVTGYTTSLDRDDRVREFYPSLYRCLPGVVSAVPADMRGRDLFNPAHVPDATDGRIQAPGVDIIVTTTENSATGYALSEAAGASSAAAYVSGAVALVWGSPPLNKCDAQQIKQLLFCRSKSSKSSRYPWINVGFLRELEGLEPGASCGTALAALGCD